MYKLEIQLIDPLNNLFRVKELLLQLNSDKEEKYLEQTFEQMLTFQNFKCFGLYDDGELVGISSA